MVTMRQSSDLFKLVAPSTYMNVNAPSYTKVKWLGILGIFFTWSGVAMRIAIPIVLTIIFSLFVKLEEGSIVTWIAKKPPIAASLNLYLWNLDNPEEFVNGAKPKLREVGPFYYHVWLELDFDFAADGETVKVWATITFNYDETRSAPGYDDKLTMLNLLAYAAVGTTQNMLDKIPLSFALQPIIYGFMGMFFSLHEEGVIKVTTPRKLIEGETLSLMETADQLVLKPLKWLGLELPYNLFELIDRHIGDNVFGLLKIANRTRVGPVEMYTGKSNTRMLGHIISIMDNILDNPINNILVGSKCIHTGGPVPVFFGHYMSADQPVKIYMPCQPMEMTRQGLTLVKGSPQWGYHWIPTYKLPTFKDPTDPCVCRHPLNPAMCDGVYDLGTCLFLAPVSLSLPHFLHAHRKITSTVDGMSPDPSKHEFNLYLNPTLGTPVWADARIQANVETRSHMFMTGMSSLPKSVYPLLWIEAGFFPGGILEFLVFVGLNALTLLDYGPYLLILLGLTILTIVAMIAFKDRNRLFDNNNVRLSPSPPIPRSPLGMSEFDKQSDTKALDIYPNLVTDGLKAEPSLAYGSRPNHSMVNSYTTVKRRNSSTLGDVEQ